MEHLKKIIILITIIIILIIVVLLVLYIRGKTIGTDYDNANMDFENDTSNVELNTEFIKVTNKNNFYAVKNIIGKYAYAIVDGGKLSVYKMLNPNYIAENKVNEDNVFENVDELGVEDLTDQQFDNLEVTVSIDEMYSCDFNVDVSTYYIKGEFVYNIDSKRVPFALLINVDSLNETFYIYPTSYINDNYNNVESLSTYSTDIESIENNGYNEFSFTNIDNAMVINDYLSRYKDKVVSSLSLSYDMIDEEYRQSKFSSLEQYQKYINEHINELLSISLSKYMVNNKEDYTEYVCLDQKGNYYIFKEKAIMDYTIMLDNYTIPTEDFINEYNNASEETRVGLNIERILQALNKKDYEFIYNKLDQTFRTNNFDTLEKFNEYMQNSFKGTQYGAEYSDIEKRNNVYVMSMTLNSELNDNIGKDIIMQLQDDYNFVMSFNV